jgi:gliding motility-associated-like protein
VLPELTGEVDTTICEGETVIVGNTEYGQPGTFEEILTGTGGCDSTVSINIEVISLEASVFQPDPINCFNPTVLIDGSNSSDGNNIIYEWSTNDGNILSGQGTPVIEVDRAGTYQLSVIFDDGSIFCESSPAFVEVLGQTTVPSAEILDVPFFSCTDGDVSIITSPAYPGIIPTWTTVDGEIISGGDSFEPIIGQPGIYQLTLVDPVSQCDSIIMVEVEGDQSTPIANIDGQFVFECGQMMITLNSNGSSTGPDFAYAWWTEGGSILGGNTGPMLVITAPGIYYLEVENTANQCVDTASFEVFDGSGLSVTTTFSHDTLTCIQGTSLLTAETSGDPADYNFNWSTNDGSISTASDSQVIVVERPGTYIVLVETSNGQCSALDSVTIYENTINPFVDAGPDLIIDCSADSFEVIPGSAIGSSISYEWQTVGGIILSETDSGTIFINRPGDYILTVTDLLNGCQNSDTMSAESNGDLPVVIINAMDSFFNCATEEIVLDGSSSSQDPDMIYDWETTGGAFIGSPDSTVILATRPGIYRLTIRDTASGCESASQVELSENYNTPEADAGEDQILTCDNPMAVLDASNTIGQSLAYSWTTSNGLIESDTMEVSISVTSSGTYVLQVTDTESFCSDTDTVLVSQTGEIPEIDFESPDTLTCDNLIVQVNADISDPSNELNYQWSTINGNILSGAGTEQITVDRPGEYLLEVIHTTTGCADTDSIEVYQNIVVPDINVFKSGDLNCDSVSSFLSVQIADHLINVDYSWSTLDGTIQGDPEQPEVEVNDAGKYFVLVRNTQNGCAVLDSIIVLENTVPPSAVAGENVSLGCTTSDVLLDGSASFGQGALTYNWSTPNGVISGNNGQAMVEISGAGLYILSIEDGANGCSDTDSVTVVSSEAPELFFNVVQPGCNESFGILVIDSISTNSPDPIISLDGLPFDPSVDQELDPGIYDLAISDGDDCSSSYVFDILEGAFVNVELPPTYNVLEGEQLTLEAVVDISTGALDSIIWTGVGPELDCYNCLQPNLLATSNGSYTIFVVSENGCEASAQTVVRILTIEEEYNVFIPNAFSPNGDGVNDMFKPYSGSKNIIIERFEIYNRWGDRVHQRLGLPITDDSLGWDGTWRSEQLNPDEFVYYIEYRDPAGSSEIVKGSVSLMR